MGNSLETNALNLCASIAHGFASHPSNKIDLDNTDNLHQTSLRTLFIILLSLYLEENGFLPDDTDFRNDTGIFTLRKELANNPRKSGGKKLSIIKRIRHLMEQIYSPDLAYAPFKARLFDPDNPANRNIAKWKFYDGEITNSLKQIFSIWAHPGTSLMSSNPPGISELIGIYTFLLDYTPRVTDYDVVLLNNGKRIIALSEAHPGDIRRGHVHEKGSVIYEYAKRKSRKSGTVYTPDEIVNRIVKRTLDPLIGSTDRKRPLRIIDPSCGTGRFLSGAVDYLIGHNNRANGVNARNAENERQIISDSIYGVDHDKLAIELAEIPLMLRTHRRDNPAPNLEANIIAADTLKGIDSHFIRRLILGNGRIDDSDADESQYTFDEIDWQSVWKTVIAQNKKGALAAQFEIFIDYLSGNNENFKTVSDEFHNKLRKLTSGDNKPVESKGCGFHPEVFFPSLYFTTAGEMLSDSGFDAVIGNPPYGDILDTASKRLLENLGYKSGGGGNNDIFRFFVERGLNLLRRGGMLGFILPNTFLKGRKYRNFRKRILELSYPEEILDFNHQKVFQRDVFTSLLFLRKKPAKKSQPRFLTSLDGSLDYLEQEAFDPSGNVDDSWLPTGELYQRLNSDKRYMRIDPFFTQIGDVGINYQRRSVGWSERTKSRIADVIFYEGKKEHPDDKEFLKGEDVERFRINPKSKRWLRHDWQAHIQDSEVVNVNYEWANRPVKILSRQTGDSLIAAIDTSCMLTGRSLHTSVVRDIAYSPYYIIALMNSDVLTRVYRELTRETGRPQAQVKLSFLRKIPIRRINFTLNESEREKMLNKSIKSINENPDNLPNAVKDSLEHHTEDIAHDLIACSSRRIEHLLGSNGSNGTSTDLEKWRNALNISIDMLYEIN